MRSNTFNIINNFFFFEKNFELFENFLNYYTLNENFNCILLFQNCANQGIINLPVVFTLNRHDLEKSNSIKYGPSLDNSISIGTAINHKHRNFLSIAQWNAYLYYVRKKNKEII